MRSPSWAAFRPEGGRFGLDLSASDAAALAIDDAGVVVGWNAAATRLFGRSEAQAVGRRCWEVIRGRDVFGNRFCHECCAVRCMVRRGETITSFEITAEGPGLRRQALSAEVFVAPAARAGGQTIVHILRPLDGETRLSRTPERLLLERWRLNGLPVGAGPGLTQRERQILGWVAAGLQNKEIAEEAGISLATVRNHVHNLLEKLGLHSKLEAASLAFRTGWVRDVVSDSRQTQPLRASALDGRMRPLPDP